ncbi:MAG: class I SAM-dependent methyltransferase [Candidatus Margulisiibacteriota bacterium]
MRNTCSRCETNIYRIAYENNSQRRLNGFGWDYSASKSVVDIIRANNLSDRAKDKRALDLGCGDGRHIDYLRRLGFKVFGIDSCKEAIRLCRDRFRDDANVSLKLADLTVRDSISALGLFDLILDWSVLDHIRKKHQKAYLNNAFNALKHGGFFILSEFDRSYPGLFKGKNYRAKNGSYSCAFTINDLIKLLKPLELVDFKEGALEDEINNYRFNTVLMSIHNASYLSTNDQVN